MALDQAMGIREPLCAAIRQALVLADGDADTLVGALLQQALEAAHCGGDYKIGDNAVS
jgi:hypothetical protein